METKKEWFADWFDTKYYHLLYCERNFTEAELFIEHLMNHLNLAKGTTLLDLACGKGRHAIFINEKGYKVLGIDLSEKSIEYAKQNENENLHFKVGDIRLPIDTAPVDVVLNLFTSFGYFEDEETHQNVLKNIYDALKPEGYFVLDFFNSDFVKETLVKKDIIVKDHISFQITKKIENNYIIKNIAFTDAGQQYEYQEKVALFDKNTLTKLLLNAGFVIENIFGSYQLDNFNYDTSERLIFIAKKAE